MSNWRIYLEWEQTAARVMDPRKSVRALVDELAQDWGQKQDHAAHLNAIRDTKARQREVRKRATVVLDDRKKADVARSMTGNNAIIVTQRSLEHSLRSLLAARSSLVVALGQLKALQENSEQEDGLTICGRRSLDYTRSLLRDAESAVTRTKVAIHNCRDAQREVDHRPSQGSIEWDAADEENDPRKDRKRQPFTASALDRLLPRGLVKKPQRVIDSAIPPHPVVNTARLPGLTKYGSESESSRSTPAHTHSTGNTTTQQSPGLENEGGDAKYAKKPKSQNSPPKRTSTNSARAQSSKRQRFDGDEHRIADPQDHSVFNPSEGQSQQSQLALQRPGVLQPNVPSLKIDSNLPSVGQPIN